MTREQMIKRRNGIRAMIVLLSAFLLWELLTQHGWYRIGFASWVAAMIGVQNYVLRRDARRHEAGSTAHR